MGQIEQIEISKLKEAPYNPRVDLEPGMPDYDRLKAGILEFGLVEPIVWNRRTGYVVGGHQRLKVLKDLGVDRTVPCHVVDLSEEEEKTLNLALNKIRGEWDYEKLDEILSDFTVDEAALAGFGADELALILADLGEDIDHIPPEFESTGEELEGSYVIQLRFETEFYARIWAEENGYPGQVKPDTTTTVIRMD